MFPVDRIRYNLQIARKEPEGKSRDLVVAGLMSDALVEARRTEEATESILINRFGFTAEEIDDYRTVAVDHATRRWVRQCSVSMTDA